MAASARPFVENLIADHRGWLLELLLRSADVRQALSTAHPDLVFAAAETNVEAFTNALDEDWLEELSVGLERSGPTAHASIEQTFPGAFAAFSNLLPGKDTNQ
jgi:hypothetical protein